MIKRCVYDTEFNGFLRSLTRFWCAGIKDVDTEETFWFRPHQFKEFLDKLDEYDIRIAHNGSGYDEQAILKYAKLQGIDWEVDTNTFADTLIMSQVLCYDRFNDRDPSYKAYMSYRRGLSPEKLKKLGSPHMATGHSLGRWGIFFKDYKGEHKDFSQFSEEMFEYMKQDVHLGMRIYKYLRKETADWIHNSGSKDIIRAIQIETDMNRISTEQHLNGWRLDVDKLPEVISKIDDRMREIELDVNPKLGYVLRKISGDKNKETGDYGKYSFVTKSGKYHSWLNNWFGFDEDTGIKSEKVEGPFCRLFFEPADIGNTDAVKRHLYKIGWVPDEWNGKRDDSGNWVKTSPKITESSLEHLEGAGDINEYYTLRSRKSIMEGWSDYIDENGRVHGEAFNVGTPTFRQTHKIVVNLPSAKAKLGPEVRSLFIAEEGWQVVSADSAACQLRLLSHYMDDPDFLRELLEGDMHQKNADILTEAARKILKDQGIVVPRPNAKPFIFAFLYGAGGPKLARILGMPEHVGNLLKEQFQKAYPKLNKLIKRVKGISKRQGFIIGLDSRGIYCNSQHKALNYLIQGAEAVIMKATVVAIWKRLREENLQFRMLLFYHDEVNIEVHNDDVDRAREIIIEEFAEAPKEFGVDIMVCGDCKAGSNYFEVH